MNVSELRKITRSIKSDTGIPHEASRAVIVLLRRPLPPLFPETGSWRKALFRLAKVRREYADGVVRWFIANPQHQKHLRPLWFNFFREDLEESLRDVLHSTPMDLPELNVYHSGPYVCVFWEDGATERAVVQYLTKNVGPLIQSREWPNGFTTSYGLELIFRRVRSRATVRVQEQSSDSSRPKPWDPSALPPGQSFVSAS